MNIECHHCSAKHFSQEKIQGKGNSFNDCCNHGKVILDNLPEFPSDLKSLFESNHLKSKNFSERI